MPIKYKEGDLFTQLEDNDCIIHCCNNIGAWGSGFVIPLENYFPEVKEAYKDWTHEIEPKANDFRSNSKMQLGHIQVITGLQYADNSISCVNMIGQNGIARSDYPRPLHYDAIYRCLERIRYCPQLNGVRKVGPKFGAGLAGGSWSVIEAMINDIFKDREIIIFCK